MYWFNVKDVWYAWLHTMTVWLLEKLIEPKNYQTSEGINKGFSN